MDKVKKISPYIERMKGLFPSLNTTKQMMKFLVVSILTIGVSLGTTYVFNAIIFQNSFMYSYMVAYFISIITGGATDFFLNKFWTFNSRSTKPKTVWKEYKRFFATNVGVTVFNFFAMFVLTSVIGVYYVISQAIIMTFRKIILFVLYRYWTFNNQTSEEVF